MVLILAKGYDTKRSKTGGAPKFLVNSRPSDQRLAGNYSESMLGQLPRRAAALIGALLAASCRIPDTPTLPVAGPTSPSPSPAFEPFDNGGRCPPDGAPELPDDIGCISAVVGNFDGRGTLDHFFVFASLGADRRPRRWHVAARTNVGTIRSGLAAGTEHSYPRVIGAADADGDGIDEVFVKVLDFLFHSGGAGVMTIFRIDPSAIARVREASGEFFDFRVGGITRLGEGGACRDVAGDERPEFVLHRVEATNVRNTRWTRSERIYRWNGNTLTLVDRRRGTLVISDYNDPKLDPFYQLRCGALIGAL